MTNLKRGACAAIVALMAATSVTPAFARHGDHHRRDNYVERYYRHHDRDNDYRRWHRHRGRWSEREYRRWYRRHHRSDDTAAAAIFGLAAGAIAAGVAANANSHATVRTSGAPSAGGYPAFSRGYLAYCDRKYRSFDPSSGTYMGYDGQRHYCQ